MKTISALEGNLVRVEILAEHHLSELWTRVGHDEDIWRWTWQIHPRPSTLDEFTELALSIIATPPAERLPMAVIRKCDGAIVGSSSFNRFSERDRHLEIGSTFYAKEARRTAINTETKLLMLTEAFENQECFRVMLRADSQNTISCKAIERIGAKYEGTMRREMMRRDGTWRDTSLFSILDSEWPAVKSRLLQMLEITNGA